MDVLLPVIFLNYFLQIAYSLFFERLSGKPCYFLLSFHTVYFRSLIDLLLANYQRILILIVYINKLSVTRTVINFRSWCKMYFRFMKRCTIATGKKHLRWKFSYVFLCNEKLHTHSGFSLQKKIANATHRNYKVYR